MTFSCIKPNTVVFIVLNWDILLSHLGVKNLILTGVAGDICVLFTADDAYMREYNLWVPSDCTASETEGDNDNALRLMKRSMFANIHANDKGEHRKRLSTDKTITLFQTFSDVQRRLFSMNMFIETNNPSTN